MVTDPTEEVAATPVKIKVTPAPMVTDPTDVVASTPVGIIEYASPQARLPHVFLPQPTSISSSTVTLPSEVVAETPVTAVSYTHLTLPTKA